jgi:ParB family chromosome partitioning protein
VNVDFLQEEAPETDLSAVFARSVADTTPISQVAIDHLLDNPYQQRGQMNSARLTELAAVIKEHGFQGVLVARPHPSRRGFYQLAFGHRRRDAARLAGVAVLPVQVRDLSEEEMVELVITENIQRDDLTLLEEGRTFQLMNEMLGYTQEQIARAVGKTRGYVENRLRVARAPGDVQALVAAKPDSLRAVSALIQVTDPDLRAGAIAELQAGRLTADDLPGYLSAARPRPAQDPATAPPEPASPVAHANGASHHGQPSTATAPRGAAPAADLPTEQSAQALAASLSPPGAPAESASAPATAGADETAHARVGYGTLMAAWRALSRYREALDDRTEVSVREQVVLADLKNLALELYERCRPEDAG